MHAIVNAWRARGQPASPGFGSGSSSSSSSGGAGGAGSAHTHTQPANPFDLMLAPPALTVAPAAPADGTAAEAPSPLLLRPQQLQQQEPLPALLQQLGGHPPPRPPSSCSSRASSFLLLGARDLAHSSSGEEEDFSEAEAWHGADADLVRLRHRQPPSHGSSSSPECLSRTSLDSAHGHPHLPPAGLAPGMSMGLPHAGAAAAAAGSGSVTSSSSTPTSPATSAEAVVEAAAEEAEADTILNHALAPVVAAPAPPAALAPAAPAATTSLAHAPAVAASTFGFLSAGRDLAAALMAAAVGGAGPAAPAAAALAAAAEAEAAEAGAEAHAAEASAAGSSDEEADVHALLTPLGHPHMHPFDAAAAGRAAPGAGLGHGLGGWELEEVLAAAEAAAADAGAATAQRLAAALHGQRPEPEEEELEVAGAAAGAADADGDLFPHEQVLPHHHAQVLEPELMLAESESELNAEDAELEEAEEGEEAEEQDLAARLAALEEERDMLAGRLLAAGAELAASQRVVARLSSAYDSARALLAALSFASPSATSASVPTPPSASRAATPRAATPAPVTLPAPCPSRAVEAPESESLSSGQLVEEEVEAEEDPVLGALAEAGVVVPDPLALAAEQAADEAAAAAAAAAQVAAAAAGVAAPVAAAPAPTPAVDGAEAAEGQEAVDVEETEEAAEAAQFELLRPCPCFLDVLGPSLQDALCHGREAAAAAAARLLRRCSSSSVGSAAARCGASVRASSPAARRRAVLGLTVALLCALLLALALQGSGGAGSGRPAPTAATTTTTSRVPLSLTSGSSSSSSSCSSSSSSSRAAAEPAPPPRMTHKHTAGPTAGLRRLGPQEPGAPAAGAGAGAGAARPAGPAPPAAAAGPYSCDRAPALQRQQQDQQQGGPAAHASAGKSLALCPAHWGARVAQEEEGVRCTALAAASSSRPGYGSTNAPSTTAMCPAPQLQLGYVPCPTCLPPAANPIATLGAAGLQPPATTNWTARFGGNAWANDGRSPAYWGAYPAGALPAVALPAVALPAVGLPSATCAPGQGGPAQRHAAGALPQAMCMPQRRPHACLWPAQLQAAALRPASAAAAAAAALVWLFPCDDAAVAFPVPPSVVPPPRGSGLCWSPEHPVAGPEAAASSGEEQGTQSDPQAPPVCTPQPRPHACQWQPKVQAQQAFAASAAPRKSGSMHRAGGRAPAVPQPPVAAAVVMAAQVWLFPCDTPAVAFPVPPHAVPPPPGSGMCWSPEHPESDSGAAGASRPRQAKQARRQGQPARSPPQAMCAPQPRPHVCQYQHKAQAAQPFPPSVAHSLPGSLHGSGSGSGPTLPKPPAAAAPAVWLFPCDNAAVAFPVLPHAAPPPKGSGLCWSPDRPNPASSLAAAAATRPSRPRDLGPFAALAPACAPTAPTASMQAAEAGRCPAEVSPLAAGANHTAHATLVAKQPALLLLPQALAPRASSWCRAHSSNPADAAAAAVVEEGAGSGSTDPDGAPLLVDWVAHWHTPVEETMRIVAHLEKQRKQQQQVLRQQQQHAEEETYWLFPCANATWHHWRVLPDALPPSDPALCWSIGPDPPGTRAAPRTRTHTWRQAGRRAGRSTRLACNVTTPALASPSAIPSEEAGMCRARFSLGPQLPQWPALRLPPCLAPSLQLALTLPGFPTRAGHGSAAGAQQQAKDRKAEVEEEETYWLFPCANATWHHWRVLPDALPPSDPALCWSIGAARPSTIPMRPPKLLLRPGKGPLEAALASHASTPFVPLALAPAAVFAATAELAAAAALPRSLPLAMWLPALPPAASSTLRPRAAQPLPLPLPLRAPARQVPALHPLPSPPALLGLPHSSSPARCGTSPRSSLAPVNCSSLAPVNVTRQQEGGSEVAALRAQLRTRRWQLRAARARIASLKAELQAVKAHVARLEAAAAAAAPAAPVAPVVSLTPLPAPETLPACPRKPPTWPFERRPCLTLGAAAAAVGSNSLLASTFHSSSKVAAKALAPAALAVARPARFPAPALPSPFDQRPCFHRPAHRPAAVAIPVASPASARHAQHSVPVLPSPFEHRPCFHRPAAAGAPALVPATPASLAAVALCASSGPLCLPSLPRPAAAKAQAVARKPQQQLLKGNQATRCAAALLPASPLGDAAMQQPQPQPADAAIAAIPLQPRAIPLQPAAIPLQPAAIPMAPAALPLRPAVIALQPAAIPLQPAIMPMPPTPHARQQGQRQQAQERQHSMGSARVSQPTLNATTARTTVPRISSSSKAWQYVARVMRTFVPLPSLPGPSHVVLPLPGPSKSSSSSSGSAHNSTSTTTSRAVSYLLASVARNSGKALAARGPPAAPVTAPAAVRQQQQQQQHKSTTLPMAPARGAAVALAAAATAAAATAVSAPLALAAPAAAAVAAPAVAVVATAAAGLHSSAGAALLALATASAQAAPASVPAAAAAISAAAAAATASAWAIAPAASAAPAAAAAAAAVPAAAAVTATATGASAASAPLAALSLLGSARPAAAAATATPSPCPSLAPSSVHRPSQDAKQEDEEGAWRMDFSLLLAPSKPKPTQRAQSYEAKSGWAAVAAAALASAGAPACSATSSRSRSHGSSASTSTSVSTGSALMLAPSRQLAQPTTPAPAPAPASAPQASSTHGKPQMASPAPSLSPTGPPQVPPPTVPKGARAGPKQAGRGHASSSAQGSTALVPPPPLGPRLQGLADSLAQLAPPLARCATRLRAARLSSSGAGREGTCDGASATAAASNSGSCGAASQARMLGGATLPDQLTQLVRFASSTAVKLRLAVVRHKRALAERDAVWEFTWAVRNRIAAPADLSLLTPEERAQAGLLRDTLRAGFRPALRALNATTKKGAVLAGQGAAAAALASDALAALVARVEARAAARRAAPPSSLCPAPAPASKLFAASSSGAKDGASENHMPPVAAPGWLAGCADVVRRAAGPRLAEAAKELDALWQIVDLRVIEYNGVDDLLGRVARGGDRFTEPARARRREAAAARKRAAAQKLAAQQQAAQQQTQAAQPQQPQQQQAQSQPPMMVVMAGAKQPGMQGQGKVLKQGRGKRSQRRQQQEQQQQQRKPVVRAKDAKGRA